MPERTAVKSAPDAPKRPRSAAYSYTVKRAVYPPLLALVALAGLLLWQIAALLSAARAVEHADSVIARATRILKLAVDAETGERGFLIGGRTLFLNPYHDAQKNLLPAFDQLERLVASSAVQTRRARLLRAAYGRWQEYAEKEIALRNDADRAPGASAGRRAALISFFNDGRGKDLMDEVRTQTSSLIEAEDRLRKQWSRTVHRETRVAAGTGTAAVVLLGLLFFYTTRRQITALGLQYEEIVDEEQTARDSLTATLYGIGDAVMVTDQHGIVTRVNPVAEQLTGWPESEARGKPSGVVFDIINETTRAVVESPVDRVIRDGVIAGLANHTLLRRRDGTEIAIDDSGAPIRGAEGNLSGVVLVFRDVTRRRQVEMERDDLLIQARLQAQRESLVNEIGTVIRNSPLDAGAILSRAVAALGQGIGADRCYYGQYDQAADLAQLRPEWHRDGLASIEADYPMSRFSINRDPSYTSGHTQVVEDVRAFTAPGTDSAEPGPLETLGLRALVRVPLQVGNRQTALAVAMADAPRRWTEHEVAVVETVASQIQSALEAARLLAEERTRAEHEALLHSISEALLESSDPRDVQRTATAALGQALGVDRCYFASVEAAQDNFIVHDDWRPPDCPHAPLRGRYRLSQFPLGDDSHDFGDAEPQVVPDIGRQTWPESRASMLDRMQVTSFVHVPFLDDGRLVGLLGVAMAGETRHWSKREVSLVQAVAAQMRTALEAARVQQRERTIATQLQEALTPAPPRAAPGLELASFSRPALEEAQVGGDFIDVFPVERGPGGGARTALVVADLSGKGLAAASQVATVRNMLRCLLYEGNTVARKVSHLNAILENNHLLTGFATLFVGVYDAGGRTLTYANCGQEPGLIRRRATGAVEMLPPTGAVLGSMPDAAFEEETLALDEGDILALFTDGLTEAGPDRRRLLGIDGVATLLTQAAPPHAESVVSHLIAGVDAYAQNGVRDDVCLLVCVARAGAGCVL